MGADLALYYALAYPDRVRGVLYVCGHDPHNDRGWSAAYQRELEERGELTPTYRIPPNMEVNAAGNESVREYAHRPSLWREIADLDVPALIVTAERDIRPAWPAVQLAHLLPNAKLEEVAGAEHSLWMTHPAELEETLRAFLKELG